jgi:glycerate 2-kinase
VHVVAAPDKFRGTATASEVAAAVAAAVVDAGGTCDRVPMADGGEGFLEAFGGPNRTTLVTGPLGDAVEASWRLHRGTAVIEMARASGLALVAEATDGRGGTGDADALGATTYGTGELIGAAVESGARRVLVGVGGSATTDGGFGALRALYPTARLRGVEILVGCDVRTRFVDAAEVFAPQKGATATEVALLRRRLERLADVYAAEYGVEVAALEGSGAAGGLAGGLAAVGARLLAGFDLVADEVELFDRLESADLVVTGEGFVDRESFDGKVVGGVLSLAAEVGLPTLVVAGQVFDDVEVTSALAGSGVGPVTVVSLVERFGEERAWHDTTACVTEVVADHLATMARDAAR